MASHEEQEVFPRPALGRGVRRGTLHFDLSWTDGLRDQTTTINPDAAGAISADLSWNTRSRNYSKSIHSVANVGTWEDPITVSANGHLQMLLSWNSALPNPDLDIFLVKPDGSTVPGTNALTGNSETLDYTSPVSTATRRAAHTSCGSRPRRWARAST